MAKTNIYIFDFGDRIKIGQSIDVKRRLRNIETQSGIEAIQHFSTETDDRYENLMHKILSEFRGVGEYFNAPFDFAVSILKSLIRFEFVKEVKPKSQLFMPLEFEKQDVVENTLVTFGKGFTIQELSKKLKISERAVYQRLHSLGIEPLTRQAIYPENALEAIKVVSKGGRPKKQKKNSS